MGRNAHDTPLLAAVDNDCREVALELIKSGADVNRPLNRGWTVLHEAVYRGHTDSLQVLLSNGGDPNIRDCFGISPVFTSAACGRNECLEMLLRSDGDPNLCAESKMASPLYEACKEGHLDCVITLLDNGANPHLVNCDGLYPIHVASSRGFEEIVEKLLPITDVTKAENCGMSPIHSAAKGDNIEILDMLINHGYDVNIKLTRDKITYRDRRQTALFFAVYNDSEEATEILLEAGAETELDYVKPLLVAVSHSQYDMTDLLLSHGADVNACFNEDGAFFPACVAFALRDFRMLKQVLISGCDVSKCLKCDIGGQDHSRFSEAVRRQSFCHFLTEDHQRAWCGCTVLYLLQFVGNVKLCSKILEAVRVSDEWEEIEKLTDNPRSLRHLCRLKIRSAIRIQALRHESTFQTLPIPEPMKRFLEFSDVQ
uniref:Ankyrin repeat and SOCS box protein 2-like n=1 Tax=Phallusia mammillata TaxID=59560 RepID=A0A6F9D747_9ASCI|nr:ankyrin repeat and SOCS box protein 2-like [Phallusia mammillata]